MCGSQHRGNWTTSRPSLPCSHSLLSNVLAQFSCYTRPIRRKEQGDVSVIIACDFVCVRIATLVCACFILCVFLGGMCSDVQSKTAVRIRMPKTSLFHCTPIKGFVFLRNKMCHHLIYKQNSQLPVKENGFCAVSFSSTLLSSL